MTEAVSMNNRLLGCKQKAVMDDMIRHGGVWPPQRRLPHDKKLVLESLRRRGLLSISWEQVNGLLIP